MADAVVKVNYNRAVVTIPGVGVAASMLAGRALSDLSNVADAAIPNTAPYGLNLALGESTDITSNRAAVLIGTGWLMGQDSQGVGTKDWFLYNATAGSSAITIRPADNQITLGGVLNAPAGIGGETYLNLASTAAGSYMTEPFGDVGFGGAWRANSSMMLAYPGEHLAGIAAFAMVNKSEGSLHNGPANAAYGAFVLSYKADYLTSTRAGELDGLFIITRQGLYSDVAGILLDTRKVGDIDGSALSIEARTARIQSTGGDTHAVHSMLGFLESTVADGGDTAFRAEARVGTINAAYTATKYSDASDAAMPGGSPYFKWIFMATETRSSDDRFFVVVGDSGAGTPGATQIGAGSKAINRVLEDIKIIDFPELSPNSTASVEVVMTGARRGDHVSVCPADPSGDNDYADERVIFSGRVMASDTVRIQAHNAGGATIPNPAGQSLSIVVMGYEATIDD